MDKYRNSLCIFFLLSIFAITNHSCKKDKSEFSQLDYEINSFIWGNLSAYYLWVENVPKLQNGSYKNETELDLFLKQTADHEEFFYSLLYQYETTDKWSWIVDDYTELENQLDGIYKTTGIDFRLGRFVDETHVFGYVRYVMKGSPADLAGVKRGDIFTTINNTKLTINNYYDLLFKNDSYTMDIDTIVAQSLASTGRKVSLTAIEGYQENPIYLDTVYSINNKKIGYLIYNAFIDKYSPQLNTVFQEFKDKAIDELILDFRYNSGGDGSNMIDLASMIHTTNTSEVFMQTKYNKELESYLIDEYGTNYLKQYFTDKIAYTNGSNPTTYYNINSLNLSKIHVITTDNTASAGEVLMCGLKPYMSVVIIGDTTAGKYVGSWTLKDYTDDKGTVNPNHKWAMQPIVTKVANKNGITDYIGGYIPDIKIQENFKKLGKLGDINEPLLQTTLNYITGTGQPASALKSKPRPYSVIADSRDAFRFKGGLNMGKEIPYKRLHQVK